MKVTALVKDLKEKLSIASRLSASSENPITQNILLETVNDVLQITATNGHQISSFITVGANVKQFGSVLVDGGDLYKFISALSSDSTAEISTTDKSMTVKSGTSSATLVTAPTNQFPNIHEPVFRGESLQSSDLLFAIDRVLFAADDKAEIPIMSGVAFDSGSELTFFATDNFRASKVKIKTGLPHVSLVIPANGLSILKKIINTEKVEITIPDKNSIAFKSGDYTIKVQLLVGQHVNYQNLFPQSHEVEAVISGDEVQSATKRALVFSEAGSAEYDFTANGLVITARDGTRGESADLVQIFELSQEQKFILNLSQLSDFLKNVPAGSKVVFRSGVADVPGNPSVVYLEVEGSDSFTYLMSPLVRK